MNKKDLEEYILNNYGIEPDFPWMKDPDSEVFRHPSNRKWFALIMSVKRKHIGLSGEEYINIVNFKCDPVAIGSILGEHGVFPAYHMNKEHWVTIALDGSASDDTIKFALDISYDITATKTKRKQGEEKTMIFLCYARCTTCQKAKKWLDANGIKYEERPIKEQNPTVSELKNWHKLSGLPLKKFFNTSGNLYKSLNLKDKLPEMSDEEMYALLATDGMLVKRPLLISDDLVLTGFKESEWQEKIR